MTTKEKALELVAENRVVQLLDGEYTCIVAGHTDHYTIRAATNGIDCDCPSRLDYCSHILAAMIVWNDG